MPTRRQGFSASATQYHLTFIQDMRFRLYANDSKYQIHKIWLVSSWHWLGQLQKQGSVVSLLKADKANMRQNTEPAPSQNNNIQDDHSCQQLQSQESNRLIIHLWPGKVPLWPGRVPNTHMDWKDPNIWPGNVPIWPGSVPICGLQGSPMLPYMTW